MNMQKYYSQLVGARIIDFKFQRDESYGWTEEWPTFTLQLGNLYSNQKVKLVLCQDEEGNGAGFGSIEELQ